MLNNNQGKKQKVEDRRRNVRFSKNKTSVTACNDSLNAKTSNVIFVYVTYGKCMLNDKHDMCVLNSCNDVNSRTKMPMVVPISTREPKRIVNQSIAKPLRRTVASKFTNQNLNTQLGSYMSMLIILFIVDSGCSKHMTGNLKLLTNFVEKFLGTVKFRNDQIAPILGYGDLVQGAVTIKRVYYVEGLNHNLFFVGQFCDADLEVAFRIGLHAQVRTVRTDKGMKFLNKTLHVYFAAEGINHQTDGENLDKMKEKGDACIFVGYSTQSRAYRVFNKRTRVIMETIHVNFDELPHMASDHNINQAETVEDNAKVEDDEFINIFCTPVQDRGETPSLHVDSSNMHTFYQRHPSEHRWTKDHPLEQVIGNPSQSVRTRCQLELDGEMCMFALNVSSTEPKNIKEAMANSAWIESMQEELHQFDRLNTSNALHTAIMEAGGKDRPSMLAS
nr:Gag-Pol polyprotein [Tanacetum cinerariifolium]